MKKRIVCMRLGFLSIALFGAIAVVQSQGSLQFHVDVQLVTLDVYVDDTAGKPITNLTRDDFVILEDGKPRAIQSFDSAETPYNILLLFDRSSSTQDQWPFLVRAVSRFIGQLPSRHRVALAAFDEKPTMLLDWQSPRELIRQAFTIFSNSGGTNVYEAMEWASGKLGEVKGRKGLIVFSDGLDNRLSKKLVSFDRNGTPRIAPPEQDADFQKMLRTVTMGRFPVYFVAVNTDQNPDPRMARNSFDLQQRRAARQRMEIVSDRSNGTLHMPRRIEDVEALYEKIGRELGYSYSLGFSPANQEPDGSYHHIEVRVRDESMRVTQSRTGYYSR